MLPNSFCRCQGRKSIKNAFMWPCHRRDTCARYVYRNSFCDKDDLAPKLYHNYLCNETDSYIPVDTANGDNLLEDGDE